MICACGARVCLLLLPLTAWKESTSCVRAADPAAGIRQTWESGSTGWLADPPKLLDRVREAIRTRHYSRRTEEGYVGWIRRYILHHLNPAAGRTK